MGAGGRRLQRVTGLADFFRLRSTRKELPHGKTQIQRLTFLTMMALASNQSVHAVGGDFAILVAITLVTGHLV